MFFYKCHRGIYLWHLYLLLEIFRGKTVNRSDLNRRIVSKKLDKRICQFVKRLILCFSYVIALVKESPGFCGIVRARPNRDCTTVTENDNIKDSSLFLICRNQSEIGQVFSYFCNCGGIDKIIRCVLEILRTDRNPV